MRTDLYVGHDKTKWYSSSKTFILQHIQILFSLWVFRPTSTFNLNVPLRNLINIDILQCKSIFQTEVVRLMK